MALEISLGEAAGVPVWLTRTAVGATIWIDGREHRCAMRDGSVTLDTHTESVWVATDHDTVYVHAFGRSWELTVVDPVERALAGGDQSDTATAPMPGTVVSVVVSEGDEVHEGQPLMMLESMKMHSEVVAWRDGTVERVHLALGDTFNRGAALVELVAPDQE